MMYRVLPHRSVFCPRLAPGSPAGRPGGELVVCHGMLWSLHVSVPNRSEPVGSLQLAGGAPGGCLCAAHLLGSSGPCRAALLMTLLRSSISMPNVKHCLTLRSRHTQLSPRPAARACYSSSNECSRTYNLQNGHGRPGGSGAWTQRCQLLEQIPHVSQALSL